MSEDTDEKRGKNVEVVERPILFSPPMVRALLAGTKTQTRRVVKSAHGAKSLYAGERDGLWVVERFGDPGQSMIKCPYGAPGDRLYVKEGSWIWCAKCANGTTPTGRAKFRYIPVGQHVVYRADRVKPTERIDADSIHQWRLKVARFMPRWASRLTLEVVSVRVERVQKISKTDALAEGISVLPLQSADDPSAWYQSAPGVHQERSAEASYGALWDSINEKFYPWQSNPYVWVVEFRKVDA